nr:ribonuclease H-like domain-containing protein [Tanacetum cinerariifolium]
MLLLKESSFTDDPGATNTLESGSSSPTVLMTSTSSSTKDNTNKPSTTSQICNHFNRGTCKFEDRCKFIHNHRNRASLSSSRNPNRGNNSFLAGKWNTSLDDLYQVTKPSTLPVAFVSTSSTTWHQRLGHPGDEVLYSLSFRQFISCNKAKSTHVCHAWYCKTLEPLSLHTSSVTPIPKSHFLALKDPNWCNAINALVKNDSWIIVPRLTDANLVRFMWLFKYKFHVDGTLSRYKARLAANGSSQQLGVEFDETFSLVVKPATIRTVLSLVVSRQWPVHQLDVKNAFLNGDLFETMYMHQPLGFVDSLYLNHVCLLQRSLYGLKRHLVLGFSGLQGTLELDLHLYASATTSLVGYTDADWAGCPSTHRSTFGYCLFLGDKLLSWSAKLQPTISRSSVEAKYRGVANVVAETAWIHNLLRKLHSPLLTATLVYCDNVSEVYMSANPVQHQRTKHIEIDIHFVRDMVKAGHVRVLHVPSRFQYADIFTKGLRSALFEDFWSNLSVRPLLAQTARAY